MKIRTKLLILLLIIALVPLLISAGLNRLSMYRLSNHLAGDIRKALTERAVESLHILVDDYGDILRRDRKALEGAVSLQAREVERRLVASPPEDPQLFFSTDYDTGIQVPEMEPSQKHFRSGADGKHSPIPVTYAEQVLFLVRDTTREEVALDLARLSSMPEAYRFVYSRQPELMYWQYTALETGIHSSYPGHGGYPPEYDPRQREWYRKTREAASLIWSKMVEVSTRTLTLAVSIPVYRPDGSFAGVTAIDVRFADLFQELDLPSAWFPHAETMLAALDEKTEKLQIVVHRRQKEHGLVWQKPPKPVYLESGDREGLEVLIGTGKSGVLRMPYRGQDALWAYGARAREQLFPIVIVPHERITAQAMQAERYVIDKTTEGMKITALVLFGVIIVVTGIAFFTSRRVTRPVQQIAEAAQKLSQGDFGAQVDIRSCDELQELGQVFNDMGPKMEERERMKHSLLLAKGVQQHFLPEEVPHLEGFELAGQSVYCDETGGDFYDFIEPVEIGPERLGLAVGDITGHGIAAALLMAEARGVLRSKAQRFGPDLSNLFQSLNNHMVRDFGEARFMTLFYAILDGQSRSLQWNSAGHGPVLWLRRQKGKIGELCTTGIPLGIFEDQDYTPAGPIKLLPGDVVLVGTDGIWEAMNSKGEAFGTPRMEEILRSSAEKPAAEIHSAIMDGVNDFLAGEPQEDDITLMVIKTL